jgi:hypothetical protein
MCNEDGNFAKGFDAINGLTSTAFHSINDATSVETSRDNRGRGFIFKEPFQQSKVTPISGVSVT